MAVEELQITQKGWNPMDIEPKCLQYKFIAVKPAYCNWASTLCQSFKNPLHIVCLFCPNCHFQHFSRLCKIKLIWVRCSCVLYNGRSGRAYEIFIQLLQLLSHFYLVRLILKLWKGFLTWPVEQSCHWLKYCKDDTVLFWKWWRAAFNALIMNMRPKTYHTCSGMFGIDSGICFQNFGCFWNYWQSSHYLNLHQAQCLLTILLKNFRWRKTMLFKYVHICAGGLQSI